MMSGGGSGGFDYETFNIRTHEGEKTFTIEQGYAVYLQAFPTRKYETLVYGGAASGSADDSNFGPPKRWTPLYTDVQAFLNDPALIEPFRFGTATLVDGNIGPITWTTDFIEAPAITGPAWTKEDLIFHAASIQGTAIDEVYLFEGTHDPASTPVVPPTTTVEIPNDDFGHTKTGGTITSTWSDYLDARDGGVTAIPVGTGFGAENTRVNHGFQEGSNTDVDYNDLGGQGVTVGQKRWAARFLADDFNGLQEEEQVVIGAMERPGPGVIHRAGTWYFSWAEGGIPNSPYVESTIPLTTPRTLKGPREITTVDVYTALSGIPDLEDALLGAQDDEAGSPVRISHGDRVVDANGVNVVPANWYLPRTGNNLPYIKVAFFHDYFYANVSPLRVRTTGNAGANTQRHPDPAAPIYPVLETMTTPIPWWTVKPGAAREDVSEDVFSISEAFLAFDTSGIPNEAVITNVTMYGWLAHGGEMEGEAPNGGPDIQNHGDSTNPLADWTINVRLPASDWGEELEPGTIDRFRASRGSVTQPYVAGVYQDPPWTPPAAWVAGDDLPSLDLVAFLSTEDFGTNSRDHSGYTGENKHSPSTMHHSGRPTQGFGARYYPFTTVSPDFSWVNKTGPTKVILSSSEHETGISSGLAGGPAEVTDGINQLSKDSNWVEFGRKPITLTASHAESEQAWAEGDANRALDGKTYVIGPDGFPIEQPGFSFPWWDNTFFKLVVEYETLPDTKAILVVDKSTV